MRRIRWKTKYATGEPLVDRLHRDLVHLVGALVGELEQREHCQELNELVLELTERAQGRLERAGGVGETGPTDWSDLRQLLAVGFPLATRSSPACRDCGLCDRVKDQVEAWLANAQAADGRPRAEPKVTGGRGEV